jgi:hypothetical protein
VAQHKIKQKSYRDYLNVEEAGKELILYAVDNDTVASLKKQYIGFGNTVVLAMIGHLHLKMVIRMMTAQKYKYKTNGYNTPWDPTTIITAYFTLLDCFQVLLGNCGIATSNKKKDNGSRSTDVAIRDLYRRPNGYLEEQGCDGANVGSTPDILHREVAGGKAILGDNNKTIAIEGGSATCTRDSSSQRGIQNTGVAVCNAAGPTCEADCALGSNKQDKYGRHDGMNERTCGGGRWQTCPPARQGEHTSGKQCHPPWRWRPNQETQA